MKQLLFSFLIIILTSCANSPATEIQVNVTNTNIPPTITSTPLPPTFPPTPTTIPAIPSATPTIPFTPEPSCDPSLAEFCITDGHFLLQRPILPPGNDLIEPIYGYGSTAGGTRDPHHGVEFSNQSGTPVHAAADGQVVFAGPDQQAVYAPWPNFYGNLVVIEHQDQLFTLYAHLSFIDVAEGQSVFAGDKIGEVGSTGGAIGSHLHFEVRRGDVEDYFATQNPELWLIPARDASGNLFGALMISVIDGNGELMKNANFTIGYYADPSQSPVKLYYATTYAPDLLMQEESVVLGELLAGHYRIAVETHGQILERWVEVESGRLTQVVFVVN